MLVLHDINLAARYGDHIYALKEGPIIAQGAPVDIINSELIENVFQMKNHIMLDPVFNTPLCIPIAPMRQTRIDSN